MEHDPEVDPLTRLAIRYGGNKWGLSFFTPIYHSVFGHLREQPIRLLEIGVGGYEFRRVGGASLAMWADYFPNGKIAGIDVEEKELDLGPRVTVLRGSQVDAEFLERVVAEHGPFDIIVDDGSHVPQHIVASFGHLFPSLTANGIYAIEDTLTAFMPKKGGVPITGGETFQLAQTILQAIHHKEIRKQTPDWQPPSFASTVRSFRAYHNLFFIEKGDNSEPSPLRFEEGNIHFENGVAAYERELARAPTAAGNAFLAYLYSQMGRAQDGVALVEASLARWPDDMKLLHVGSIVAGRAGEDRLQRRYLERAVELDPKDTGFRKLLNQVKAATL